MSAFSAQVQFLVPPFSQRNPNGSVGLSSCMAVSTSWLVMVTPGRPNCYITFDSSKIRKPSLKWIKMQLEDEMWPWILCVYMCVYIYMSPVPGPSHPPPMVSPPPLLTPPPPQNLVFARYLHIYTHIHIYTPLSTLPTSHLYVICSTWEPRPRQRTLSTCIFLS